MRKAFTILELMAVVAIMGILLGIVVAAAANSIRLTRTHKTNAIRAVVQQGMETYHSQKDKWPGTLGDVVGNGDGPVSKSNTEGFDGTWNHDVYIMDSPEEVKALKDEGFDLHFYRMGSKEFQDAVNDENVRLIRLASVDKMDTVAVLGTLPPEIPATDTQEARLAGLQHVPVV